MRHYKIAANGTVPCFYELHKKPGKCAPHGLKDLVNVIRFKSAAELTRKIEHARDRGIYSKMQANALIWAQQNSCEAIA